VPAYNAPLIPFHIVFHIFSVELTKEKRNKKENFTHDDDDEYIIIYSFTNLKACLTARSGRFSKPALPLFYPFAFSTT